MPIIGFTTILLINKIVLFVNDLHLELAYMAYTIKSTNLSQHTRSIVYMTFYMHVICMLHVTQGIWDGLRACYKHNMHATSVELTHPVLALLKGYVL